jgi:phenylacetate-CoA ligase
MNSAARLRAMMELRATILCCTPTYAIHLAEVAAKEGIDLRTAQVRTLSVAGEPGGSIPATRARLQELWPGARVYDHHGMTEVGPVSYECPSRPGVLHVIERAFIAEVVDPASGQLVGPGAQGELILTNLGRLGSPLLRYRTGDLVKLEKPSAGVCACGTTDLALEGGILGRVDDMVVVRGVNVYPGAVEEIIRRVGGVAEYQVAISQRQALVELGVTIEPFPEVADGGALAQRLARAFETGLALRVPVALAPAGSLPRYEMKSRRWVRQ